MMEINRANNATVNVAQTVVKSFIREQVIGEQREKRDVKDNPFALSLYVVPPAASADNNQTTDLNKAIYEQKKAQANEEQSNLDLVA